MSPMRCAPRGEVSFLILFLLFSGRLFATPLITHPLARSPGANSLLDVSSNGTRFSLTSGMGRSEFVSVDAGKGAVGDGAAAFTGTAGQQNVPRSGGSSVGSAVGSASDQGSAQDDAATSGAAGGGPDR